MASSIEDILMAKARADAEGQLNPVVGPGVGATAGTLLGALSGVGAKRRMAGGLVGAIVGGGLGAGIQNMAKQQSPSGALLAKIQSQGELDAIDRVQLQAILKDIYNNPVI